MYQRTYLTALVMGLLVILIAGCSGEGKKAEGGAGEGAPEYEFLLDADYWKGKVQDEQQWDAIPEEDRWLVEAASRATGFDNWNKVSLSATKTSEGVQVTSVTKYKGGLDDDTLSYYVNRIDPVGPKLLNGFKEEGKLWTFALGNLEGMFDAIASGLLDSKAVSKELKSSPNGEEIWGAWFLIKMSIKGLYEQMKEKTYPLLGSEFVYIGYTNEDFVGWEHIADAENISQSSPTRSFVAIATEEPGLAEATTDFLENLDRFLSALNIPGLSEMGSDMADAFDDSLVINSEMWDENEIFYISITDDYQIGWTEYAGAMFISDLDTLRNISDYFDLSTEAQKFSGEYNMYMSADLEKWRDTFHGLVEEIMSYYEEEVQGSEGKDMTPAVSKLVDIIRESENLGHIEAIIRNSGKGLDATLKLTDDAGPLFLQLRKVIEESMEKNDQESD